MLAGVRPETHRVGDYLDAVFAATVDGYRHLPVIDKMQGVYAPEGEAGHQTTLTPDRWGLAAHQVAATRRFQAGTAHLGGRVT